MKSPLNMDKNLWFEHDGCEGKHYLLGKSTTHPGKLLAWCPKKRTRVQLELSEMNRTSKETDYWIRGFLAANASRLHTDPNKEVYFENQKFRDWVNETLKTGIDGMWE